MNLNNYNQLKPLLFRLKEFGNSILKPSFIVCMSIILHFTASAYGQQKITISASNVGLVEVLSQIENKSDYKFLYQNDIIPTGKKITINAQNEEVSLVLNKIFAGTTISYQISDKNLIVLSTGIATTLVAEEIKGRITNANGEPIVGATITEKGTKNATSTDANGNFNLNVDAASKFLVVSSVGYETYQIAITKGANINLSLTAVNNKLDEIVVIGYGTANKRDLTGSITKVSGKEVADKPNLNPVASLQGKVAGLSIVNNGTPGKAPDIRIRGTNSLGGDIHPLYVVDGIFNDNIDYINPNDIESIEVLKDPSSLAIFGVRGANGVIAVTTKRAKVGQTIINLNTAYGTKKLVDKIAMADAAQFKTLYDEEKMNDGTFLSSPFDYSKWTANTDWVDAVTRTAKFNTNNLSITTSTDKNKFSFGFGYANDEGIIKHQKLEKFTLSLSDEVKLKRFLKVGFGLNSIVQNQGANADYFDRVLDGARKVAPIVSAGTIAVKTKNPYGIDSTVQDLYYDLPSIQNSGVVNPLIQLENEWKTTKNREYRNVANLYGDVSFLRNFNFRATIYADMSSINTRKYTPVYNAYDNAINKAFLYSTKSSVSEADENYRKFQSDFILNYKKSLGSHNINLMSGFTTYSFNYAGRFGSSSQNITGAAIPNDPRFWYVTNGFEDAASIQGSSNQYERNTASFLARGLYNYKNKYFLSASYRRDGSSAFPNNRWQNFWALGVAWELTKESFMQNLHAINFLKLKASTGELGVQNTGDFKYPSFPLLANGSSAVFGNLIYNAARQQYIADANLKWERNISNEVGVELEAFNRKLHFEANYYAKTTKDLLLYISGSSASEGLINKGALKNSGLELSSAWNQTIAKDFVLTVSGNFTTYKNNVEELASEGLAIFKTGAKTEVGSPVGAFYGYIVEGIYQSYADKLASPVNTEFAYGPGDLKYKDVNGDGVINAKDRTYIGNPTPDFTYAGSINLRYKAFDIGADFGGVYGNEIFRTWGGTESPFQRVNYPAFKINRWTGAETSNWDPILGQGHRINYEASTYNIEDGSYFRLRNFQLGYNVNQSLISKIHIKNIRFFMNMQNPKTWKNNQGYTPEFGGDATSFGVDYAGGAIPSVTTFGLNITF